MMFPVQAFSLVLDFAKGNQPWSVEVFEAVLDLTKWCYRAVAGNPQLVGADFDMDDPVKALEQLQLEHGADPTVTTFNPLLIGFVLQFLAGLILEKLKK